MNELVPAVDRQVRLPSEPRTGGTPTGRSHGRGVALERFARPRFAAARSVSLICVW
jgi:hypothetical protein